MADNESIFQDLKRNPVFKEIVIESGHPEISVENLTSHIEDAGYDVSSYGSHIEIDDAAEGVKDFRENLEATRSEDFYKENAKQYKTYGIVGLILSILITIYFISNINAGIGIVGVILWIVTIIFFKLSKPEVRSDTIWIRVTGKIYSGTKARKIRDSGENDSGMTKTASSVYIYSELKFSIGADSEIGVERVREDVGKLSKYLQKI